MLDRLRDLHAMQPKQLGDPEIDARIAQYEMAYRMQASVPGVMDVSDETPADVRAVRPDSRTPGTFAANCLLARRLAERGVQFIQLYHQGWDQHDNLPEASSASAARPIRPARRSITDLKQRGLLDDTLVVWGGEFGRTSYSQGKLTATNYGRDHHPRCFTIWMAGGGVKPGLVYGATDDFGYNVTADGVHVHDFHATHAAPARRRPRAPDLLAPGPPLPADRRARQGRHLAARVGRKPHFEGESMAFTVTKDLDAAEHGHRLLAETAMV